MKNTLALGILMSGSLFTSAIHAGGATEAWGFAPETSLYLGAGLGAANQSQFEDSRSGAGKVYGGIRYRAVGAEAGYLHKNEAEYESFLGRNPAIAKSELNSLYAAAVGYMPLQARTELIGKLGVAYWDQDNAIATTDFQQNSNEHISSEDTGFSPLLGIGAQYQLYQNMSVRGEWERIFSAGEGNYESDINLLTLGINMSTL